MQEICQSGSEGGAKRTFVPTPILAQGFNPGNHPNLAIRPEGARDHYMMGACSYSVRSRALAGRMVVVRRFPGLKPRAESFSPFGALKFGTFQFWRGFRMG
jgi:hypothetical protein